jgi:small subunit ribosomal protein S13
MARIAGINLPQQKKIQVALTYIYGVGTTTAALILRETKVSPDLKVKDLTPEQESKLASFIDKKVRVEGELRREVLGNIKRLKEINSLRGVRHSKKLPVRGQRTRTNARTKRGKKITVGSGRRKAPAPT